MALIKKPAAAVAKKPAAALKKPAAAVMKVMKKAKSKTATGPRARIAVFLGRKEKTSGGLTAGGLAKNKQGKIVAKSASIRAKKAYAGSALKKWADACKAGRKALGLTGFVPMGGKTPEGKALLAKAKAIMESS